MWSLRCGQAVFLNPFFAKISRNLFECVFFGINRRPVGQRSQQNKMKSFTIAAFLGVASTATSYGYDSHKSGYAVPSYDSGYKLECGFDSVIFKGECHSCKTGKNGIPAHAIHNQPNVEDKCQCIDWYQFDFYRKECVKVENRYDDPNEQYENGSDYNTNNIQRDCGYGTYNASWEQCECDQGYKWVEEDYCREDCGYGQVWDSYTKQCKNKPHQQYSGRY